MKKKDQSVSDAETAEMTETVAENNEVAMSGEPKRQKMSPFKSQKVKNYIFVISLIILPLTQFIVFWGFINFDSLLMAFQSPTREGFTTINFKRFFHEWSAGNNFVQNALLNTFIAFFVSNFISVPLVLICSFFLFKRVYGYKSFRVIFYLPHMISGAVMAMMFKYLCYGDGPILSLAQTLGITVSDNVILNGLLGTEKTAFATIMFYNVWSAFGLNMILYLGAMMRIPEEVLESARIDGIGLFGEFGKMVMPMIWPTVTTMIVLGLTGLFVWYGPIMLLTYGSYRTTTIGWYIISHVLGSSGIYSYNYPAAVGMLCTVISVPLVFGVKAILDKITEAVEY